MERLLTLKLDAIGCEAEALLNGVPLARVHAGRPSALVPIHEYTLAGTNRLELVIWPYAAAVLASDAPPPPPIPLVSDGVISAHARILLPRIGNTVDETQSRTLGQIEWAPADRQAYTAPVNLSEDLAMPVSFPRWRWMDAPRAEITPALRQQALALLQQFQLELAAGDANSFMTATRFRGEELAVAYPQDTAALQQRLRGELEQLQGKTFMPLDEKSLLLRRLAGGRLLECLDASGEPALRTEPDEQGRQRAYPLRMAAVEGKLYVLR